jgi:hypothetical protein
VNDARFADELAAEFDIPRGGLAEAIETWGEAYGRAVLRARGGAWSETEATKLDELDKALRTTWHLLWELEPQLARELAGVGTIEEEVDHFAEVQRKEDQLKALRYFLANFREAALRIPRRRPRRGEHHHDYKALRALVKRVVDFWELDIRLEFKQDHKVWVSGRDGKLEPSGKPALFAFRVVEHFAPGAGITLKTLLREFPTRRRRSPQPSSSYKK